jgi:AcrR family transcriptional regulator
MGRKSMADTRRQEIIDAFYRCVNSEGLAGDFADGSAGQAGVQPSVIHHYFKDRDEMIAQMVTFFSDTIFTDFIRKMDRYKNPETRFFKALEFMYSPGMINEEYSGFFLECCVEARRNPRVRETLAKTFRRFRQTIIANIEEMDILNDLTKQQKENYASMMIAVHEGLELQWYIEPRAVSLKKAAALTRQIIDMIVADSRRVSAPEKGGDGIE